MHKLLLIIGASLAGLAVVLGAFGAHGLKNMPRADAEVLSFYQTGVQYHMYHALALLAVGLLAERLTSSFVHYSGFFFVAGIVFFSGSLYLMTSLRVMDRTIPKAVGILTPVGGLFFIIGWLLLIIALLRK